MKNKRAVQIILILMAVLVICTALYVVPILNTPQQEEITKFKSLDINLSSNSTGFYYSFTPDGSGVIYVDLVGSYGPYETHWDEIKYIFYYLDFKSGEQEVIHVVDFNKDFYGEQPFIYWTDQNTSLLGAQLYTGLCGLANLNGTVIFNLQTKESTPVNCVTRSGSDQGGIYFQNFSQLYANYTDHKQSYNIFKVTYAAQYSDASYIFVSHDRPIYLFGNYIDDRVTSKEKLAYDEFDKNSSGPLVNKEYVPQRSNQKIYSKDKQYYFIWKLGFSLLDAPSENYLEVYNSNNKMIRKISLGDSGQMTLPPNYLGYIDFWSNDGKIVVIPDRARSNAQNHYKIYFIDPVK